MTSSMITGERRWASARRGGMTVLGKVAVPKPINLPSQKLENHGVDPNVEIVPKGTLSWGSRPSSAGSNAWGASSLSPRTDGSSSPKHLAGRPSSGGGTRPSTAGSEKASESNVGAWGSNSRPSSASGVVASSNSSLTSLRPRSAETRPGSSQLSRFAEPSAESSVSRTSNATSERMGAGTTGNDGFSLSSGDFPTLGSEKDESRKNMEPLDCAPHGRPGSSSGRLTTTGDNVAIAHGDEMSRNADFKGNSWRNDGPTYVDDGPRPGMERWRGEPPPYPNHNMGPPHYESWRGGPPVNPPGGVWYRGPAGPPPYGAPPGGFPMEPFPYYRPQVPPHGVANSQPIPPGAGPHGPHPKNGDMYRGPPMPDSYMRPGMPMRPGFYPGPVPYEGYYGPPMGFCNPNERDMPPFMGMAPPGPPIYNRPPVNQNGPDPNNSRPRSREHRGPDQVEHVRNDPRGNYKVLTKQNDNSWHQNEEERWNHNRMIVNAPNREKGILSRSSVQESAWADDPKDMHYGKSVVPAEEVPSQTFEKNLGSNDNAKSLPVSSANETDRSCVTENASASPRDHSLIQKIEGLNAKARATGGGRQDGSHREQQPLEKVHIVNAKGNRPAIDATSDVNPGRHHRTGVIPGSPDINIATVEKSHESGASSVTTATSRAARGVLNRGDHQGRGRLNGQEADGRMKKAESHSVVSAAVSESTNDEAKQHHPVVQPGEGPKPDVERRGERASAVSTFDQSDTQRAKMREIAKQRAIQLQKEEEERTREQKAKALAKLEELNRRSANQGVESQSQSSESVPSLGGAPNKLEDSGSKKQPEPNLDAGQSTESGSVSSTSVQTNERSSSGVLDSHVGGVTKKSVDKDPVVSQNQSEAADAKLNLPQVREAPKQQKRVAHKQRQNAPSQKTNMQETTPSVRADALKDQGAIAPPEEASGNLAAGREVMDSTPLVSDSQVHHKKKNNKSGKNKHKMEEPPNATATISSSEAALQKDSKVAHDSPDDSGKVTSDLNNVNPSSSYSSTDVKDQPLENHSSLSREDVHGRQNNSWKGQHSRKSRGPQNNRVPEKSHGNDAAVVWAPVRSNNNKADVTEQTGEKVADLSVPSEVGSSAVPRNNSKTKRAEMERYVPKPVAKELAQQGSTQHSSSPPSTEPEGSGTDNVTKAGPLAETKHVDGRHHHNKQHKVQQGAWRQRVPVQSSSQDSSSSTANPSNSSVQPSEKSHQSVTSEETRVGGTHSGGPDVSFCDGWDGPGDPNFTSSAPVFEMKAHASSQGRGKRNPSSKGGHKTSGYNQNFDRKDPNPALTDSQYPPLDTNQAPSRENRAGGDRSTTSQWQPKLQGPQGNRRQGDQDVNPNNVESYSEDKHGDRGMPNLGNEESKRDNNSNNNNKRGNSSSFRGHSNQGPMIEAESGSSGGASDGLNEQRPTSGYRQNANYGGRPNRDWSSTSQENKQHYSSGNRDRQRQNSHYEYQPVGPHNNNNTRRPSNDHPGALKDNQAGGQKFRERGNNYSRRGGGRGNNYYGRQSGGNPSDAGGY